MRTPIISKIAALMLIFSASFLITSPLQFTNASADNYAVLHRQALFNRNLLAKSGNLTAHSPIQIVGDVQLAAFFAGNSTNGSVSNPFVLEGLTIDASSSIHGLEIINTTLNVHIKNNLMAFASNPAYSSKMPSGIKLHNVSNVRIINNTLEQNYLGISIDISSNITIMNNSIVDNQFIGIASNFSKQITLLNNVFINCGLHILGTLADCLSLNVDDSNRINENGRLIFLTNIKGRALPDIPDGSQVILVNCTGVILQGITTSASSIGIMLLYSNNNTIQNNVISNKNYHSIVCAASNNNIIKNNSLSGAIYSLGLMYCNGSRIEGNRVSGAIFDGIVVLSCNDTVLTRNTLNNNVEYGIKLVKSSRCLVLGNSISKSEVGIGVAWDDYNITISENLVSSCTQYGIVVDFSGNVTINGNTIESCDVALRISQMPGSAIVYLNNFLNSTTSHVDLLMISPTSYNNTLWGNYWDDYVDKFPDATETDRGTWITPYCLGTGFVNVTDHHALVSPNRLPHASFSVNSPVLVVGEVIGFSFTGDPGDDRSTFTWYYGDGTSSVTDEARTWHVYESPGDYNVSLIVSDKHGEQAFASLIIHVDRNLIIDNLPFPLAFLFTIMAVVLVFKARKKVNPPTKP
jgi:parallel beta-helix repeat protein